MKKNITCFLIVITVLSCSPAPYSNLGSKQKKIFIDYQNSRLVLSRFIANNIDFNENDTVCDIASGLGTSIALMSVYLPKSTHFYAEDISIKYLTKKNFDRTFEFYAINSNSTNIEVIQGEKDKIPFSTNSLNYITLFDGIHEFDFKEKMLNEIHRVLRDTGKLLLMETVSFDSLTTIKNKSCGFYYLKNREFNEFIKNANFKILKDTISTDTYFKGKTYMKAIILAKK